MCQQRLFLWWEMEKIPIWTTLYVSQKYYRNSLPVSSKNEVVGLWMLWCATMKSILFYFQFSKNLNLKVYLSIRLPNKFTILLVIENQAVQCLVKMARDLDGPRMSRYVCSAHSIVCHGSCTNLKKDLVIVTIATDKYSFSKAAAREWSFGRDLFFVANFIIFLFKVST